jgi:hypothetical protein
MMRAASYLGLGMALTAVLPGAVAALSIPTILCDMGNGKFADDIYVHDANDEWLPDITTFIEVSDRDDNHQVTQVIAHCASGQAVRYYDEMSDDAYATLRRVIEGDEPFTLRQLATNLKQKGVQARYVTNAKRHCACRRDTHKPSF